jgi:hypothetical protein
MGVRGEAGELISRVLLLLLVVLFVQSRWVALNLEGGASDVPWYARYAREYGEASQRGQSFYDYHASAVQDEIDAARAAGKSGPSEEYKMVEYPPLAVVLWQLPRLWMSQPEAGADSAGEFSKAYVPAYRLGMAVLDVALCLLVVGLARRLFASEPQTDRLGRLLSYVLSTLTLLPFLYDRLDLLQAALVVLAFGLLASHFHYVWSFAALTLAVQLKLVPVVLVPVWVVGSLPVAPSRSPFHSRLLATLAARGALLLVLVVGGFLFAYAWLGPRSLEFLEYHRSRGLEIESFWGSLLLALRPLGHNVEVYFSHCSLNVRSSLSSSLASASGWGLAALGLAAAVGFLAHCQRLADRLGNGARPGQALAYAFPQTFICYSLLFPMVFIATNKVFSPQYLLWLAPFVALVPFRGAGRWLFQGTFFLACLLSSALLILLGTEVVTPGTNPYSWTVREPTVRFVVLLLLRNLLFLGLLGTVVGHLVRDVLRLGASPHRASARVGISPGDAGPLTDDRTTPLTETAG